MTKGEGGPTGGKKTKEGRKERGQRPLYPKILSKERQREGERERAVILLYVCNDCDIGSRGRQRAKGRGKDKLKQRTTRHRCSFSLFSVYMCVNV